MINSMTRHYAKTFTAHYPISDAVHRSVRVRHDPAVAAGVCPALSGGALGRRRADGDLLRHAVRLCADLGTGFGPLRAAALDPAEPDRVRRLLLLLWGCAYPGAPVC